MKPVSTKASRHGPEGHFQETGRRSDQPFPVEGLSRFRFLNSHEAKNQPMIAPKMVPSPLGVYFTVFMESLLQSGQSPSV
jgi:hypothetical protein